MFYQGSEASASPDSCEAEALLPIIRIPELDTLIIEYTASFYILLIDNFITRYIRRTL